MGAIAGAVRLARVSHGDPQALLPVEVAFGSDPNGLICGYLFEAGRSCRAIDLAGAIEWLAAERPPEECAFVWLHFNLADASAET